MTIRATVLLAALLGTIVVGCNGAEEEPHVPEPRDERLEGTEGLTPEELRREGEPLTQEEALERGVLDTTIYMEPLDPDEPLEPTDPLEPEEPDTIPPRSP
jgi:hypothetical protein